MSNELSFLAVLYDKAENLILTSFRLWQLKSLTKLSELLSGAIANIILITGFFIFVLFLNIGVAFWISDYFDSTFSGFIIVALFNLVLALFISYIFKNTIQLKLKNYIFSSQFGKTNIENESKNLELKQTISDFRIKQQEEMLCLKEHLMVIEDNLQPVNVIKNSIAQIKVALETKTIWIDLLTIGISILLDKKKKDHHKNG
jgi:uncharacterized membrane protein